MAACAKLAKRRPSKCLECRFESDRSYVNRKWNKPENEERLRLAVANNTTIADVARDLGLAAKGGNYKTIKAHVVRLGLSTDHHVGQAWNRENYSAPDSRRHKNTIRAALIREHGHKCWKCNLSEWMGQSIPLEMDHIDGNNSNNELDNLRILCCNCHAQTPTFRNKRRMHT